MEIYFKVHSESEGRDAPAAARLDIDARLLVSLQTAAASMRAVGVDRGRLSPRLRPNSGMEKRVTWFNLDSSPQDGEFPVEESFLQVDCPTENPADDSFSLIGAIGSDAGGFVESEAVDMSAVAAALGARQAMYVGCSAAEVAEIKNYPSNSPHLPVNWLYAVCREPQSRAVVWLNKVNKIGQSQDSGLHFCLPQRWSRFVHLSRAKYGPLAEAFESSPEDLAPADLTVLYTEAAWRLEVVAGDTRLNYEDWIIHQAESDGVTLPDYVQGPGQPFLHLAPDVDAFLEANKASVSARPRG